MVTRGTIYSAMLRICTCSWKYPSWKGLVYTKASGIDYLAEYAKRYNTVEVDQWFLGAARTRNRRAVRRGDS